MTINLQLKIVASRDPSFRFKSISCFQLPSGSCSLRSFFVKKVVSNLVMKGEGSFREKARLNCFYL